MKLSKVLHIISVLVGFIGIGTLVSVAIARQTDLVFGFTREHLLFCSIIIFLIAIWLQVATIHHVMIEKDNK
jgi:hypothetical protein